MNDSDLWAVLAGALNLTAALVRLGALQLDRLRRPARHTASSRPGDSRI